MKEEYEFRRKSFAKKFSEAQHGYVSKSVVKFSHRQSREEAQTIKTPYFAKCELLAPPYDWAPQYTCAVVTPKSNAPWLSVLGGCTIVPIKGNIGIEMLRMEGETVSVQKEMVIEAIEVQATVPHRLVGDGLVFIIWDQFPARCKSFLMFPHFAEGVMTDRKLYPFVASGLTHTIRELRLKSGLEIFEAAQLIDFDRAQQSRLESGGTNPGEARLKEIAELLGFNPDDFFLPLWYSKALSATMTSSHRVVSLVCGELLTISDFGTGSMICLSGRILVQSKSDGHEDANLIDPLSACHLRDCRKLTITSQDESARVLVV